MEIKTEINKCNLIKFTSFCIAKDTTNKVKKKNSTFRMEENYSKGNNWQIINFQNIQAGHATQYQKSKQPNQKFWKGPEETFLQRRHTDG